MASAFPASTFFGFDVADDAISTARRKASELALPNARFEVLDIAELPPDPPFDVITAFDVIHDLADPAGALARIEQALTSDGVFLMVDVHASSRLEDNLSNPFAPLMYANSVLYCMTVSLACDGAGLGMMWGEQTALEMLERAGFADVSVHQTPGDPFNSIYVGARRARRE